jgi:ATP-dependent RNA helicase MSS116
MINEDPHLASRSAAGTARSTDIRGIILSPTRELAEQIAAEARQVVRNTGLVVQCAVGGTRKSDMLRQTQRQGCHLLVATPGRLNDILSDPSSGISAPNLAALVLDEADRMLDVGFEAEINSITKCLPDPSEKVRQTILVSATIPDNVIRLARNMVRPDDFQFVQTIAQNESLTHDRVPQNVVATSSFGNIFPTLFEIIHRGLEAANQPGARPFKAIVYFNTTALVQLASVLGQERRRSGALNVPTIAIHSRLTQPQRERAAKMFKTLRSGIMFSSDVTARGMDFPDVTHVIQMDNPSDRETYIHRLGRTARQGKEGTGYLILPPLSVRTARRDLEGLPLTPDSSLECATAPLDDETNQIMVEMRELGKWIHAETLSTTYKSVFGGFKGNKHALVDDLNEWVIKGLGQREPPAVNSAWARKLGLSGTNVNVGRESEPQSFQERAPYGQQDRGRRSDRFSSQFGDRVGDDRRQRGGFGGERRGRDSRQGGFGGGRSRGYGDRDGSSW